MKTYSLEQIKEKVKTIALSECIKQGFIDYSNGKVVVPPVGELNFDHPIGDAHIKYGYIKDAETYVIKIASGFYDNPKLGLPSSSGLMLVFSQTTGFIKTILLDEGYLTDVRTAVAGQICAKELAPSHIKGIGVLGTGIQARMQVDYLKGVTPCRDVYAWGPTIEHIQSYKKDMDEKGFNVSIMDSAREVAKYSNLIVTTTPSRQPLLYEKDIQSGTHITAMGSDTKEKQELDSKILQNADIVVADSLSQCQERGEIFKALSQKCIQLTHVQELGKVLQSKSSAGCSDTQISVADLTGVAVQDVQIATAVCDAFEQD